MISLASEEFVVYVMHSMHHGKIYIGQTSQLIARFHSHNELSRKGWSIRYRPWVVIHVEFFESRTEALRREKELKSARGRKYIREEIIGASA
ncbi:MAG: GIY-YIG nuclease family protein [Saprospiraceae bacterium]|nr:GIY-YIG nuclease family protein [Saprospiraceae bacterium]